MVALGAMVTVTHVKIGEPAFGVAPARAEIWATLRTMTDAGMEDLCVSAEHLVLSAARNKGLSVEISHDDIFQHCENAPEAVAHLRRALDEEGVSHDDGGLPLRAARGRDDHPVVDRERTVQVHRPSQHVPLVEAQFCFREAEDAAQARSENVF